MNIIEFLIADHDRLRKDCMEIKNSLSSGKMARERIKHYIGHLELHEAVEQRFLISKLKALQECDKLNPWLTNYEEEHKRMWSFLDELLDVTKMKEFSVIQKTFFDFFTFVESHVLTEEQTFFPAAEKLLDQYTLEECCTEAQRYYERHGNKSMVLESCQKRQVHS